MNAPVMFELKNKVAGYYRIHKGSVDENGVPIPGTRREVAAFKNLITNQGMNYFYNTVGMGTLPNSDLYSFCFVGTGNTTPAFTDTQLVALLNDNDTNFTSTTVYVSDADGDYWRHLRTYRFNAGTATGNIAEVGVGRRSDLLFSRALILDSGGSPTTITVLSTEYLDVTYEVRNYIDLTDHVIVATISGTPYTVTYRPADIAAAPLIYYPISSPPGGTGSMELRETDVLGAVTSKPSGAAQTDLGLTILPYVTDSWYADCVGDWGLTAGNFTTGIGSMYMATSQAKYQFSFSPKIPKDATKILQLIVRVSWARH